MVREAQGSGPIMEKKIAEQHCAGKLLGNVLSALCAAATILLAIKHWKCS